MVNPTWEERDLPVLRAAVEYCEEKGGYAEVHHLRSRLDMSERDIRKAFRALCSETPELFQKYLHSQGEVVLVGRPTGEARRRVGLWPTPESLADRLIQAMAQAAEREPDPETRGWLRKTADWLGSAGRDIAVDVAGTALAKSVGAS